MAETENVVLCGANSYNQKYYFNQAFSELPESIKEELQTLCVWFTEDIGGILTMEFDADGSLMIRTEADEGDYYYDEIGAGLKLHQMQVQKTELMESLELFYKIVFLHQSLEEAGLDS